MSNPIPRALPLFVLTFAACVRDDNHLDKFDFVDVAERAGVTVKVVCGDPRRWYIPESNGSGAAWLDYDGDGDVDLFVGNGGRLKYVDDGKKLEIERGEGCRLYRNDKDWRFADVTAAAGAECFDWVNGVSAGDLDNDGDPDLYLANFGEDRYLRNDGGKLVDATKESGLTNPKWAAHAAFGDADNDGDLDVYVANYCEFDVNAPPAGGKRNVVNGVEVAYGPEGENPGINVGAPDVFFVNEGNGRFREATKEAGLELTKALCSYAAIFADVDNDGLADILVANDAQPSNLFHNLGKLTFREEGEARGFAFGAEGKATAAMGLSAYDMDGDGDLDVYKSNFDMEANSLYLNTGKGSFVERAAELGLAAASVDKLGWGCGFADFDNDGDVDIVIANGHVYPQAEQMGMHGWLQKTQLFASRPGWHNMNVYHDATANAGPGFAPLASSRGVAIGDPDDDGDLDLVIIDLDERPRVLENRTARSEHWLGVKLRGRSSNRDGTGAKVTVFGWGKSYYREARPIDGLYSTNDPRMHFGLGSMTSLDRVEVIWPGGATQTVKSPPIDAYLTIEESKQ